MRVYVIGLLCIAVLAGCGSQGQRVVVTEAAAETVVAVDVGDVLEVALEANPTTGYTWQVGTRSTQCVALAGEPVFTPMTDLMGAGGVMSFEFDVVAEGEGELILEYRRPWEDAPPLQEVVVSVAVSR